MLEDVTRGAIDQRDGTIKPRMRPILRQMRPVWAMLACAGIVLAIIVIMAVS